MNGPLMTLRTAVILTLGSFAAVCTAALTALADGSTAQALLAGSGALSVAVPTLHRLIAADPRETDRV